MRRLIIGSLNYSSWSARPWLALTHAGLEFRTHLIELFVDPKWRDKLLQFSGAAKVPVLIDGSLSVHESLAICEYVAELAPAAGLWPADTALRARARAISCEMLSGFHALRSELPTNVRARATRFTPTERARSEIGRVFDIWSASLQSSGGPFLFGSFSIADCMYAPVATRFRTYGVELSADAARYSDALWRLPAVQQWEQLALQAPAIPAYDAMVP